MIEQFDITLPSFPPGCHLITHHIQAAVKDWPQKGLVNIFIRHTSAGLTITENADPTVREDLADALSWLAPQDSRRYRHDDEGPDDMPAHIKNSLVGCSLAIPIRQGKMDLGMWQGICLCEFRNDGGRRKLTVTVYS